MQKKLPFLLTIGVLFYTVVAGPLLRGDDDEPSAPPEVSEPSPEPMEPPSAPEPIDSGSTDYNDTPAYSNSSSGGGYGGGGSGSSILNSSNSAFSRSQKKTNINPKAIITEETLRTQYVVANMMIIKSTCNDLVPDLKTFVEFTRITAEHLALEGHKSAGKTSPTYAHSLVRAATDLLAVVLISEDIDQIYDLEELNEVDLMLKNQVCQKLNTSNQEGLFFKDKINTAFFVEQAEQMLKFAQKLKAEAIRQTQLKILKEDISNSDKKILEKLWSQAETLADKSYSSRSSGKLVSSANGIASSNGAKKKAKKSKK